MHIMFIQTGGTIDKDYPATDTNHGYYFEIAEPSFLRILERAEPDFSYKAMTVLKKDSLDITDKDRTNMYKAINTLDEDRIVITHGTDTIFQTAKKLSTIKDKTIVVTGARLPEKFYDSDAEFNIGMAVAAAQVLPHGVYIALYGLITPWDKFNNK
ncbi:asparaginase [Candidatus Saccharibacteria bacterium]|nr:asparaginase [Candidatus Saccharibacteria bacterium]